MVKHLLSVMKAVIIYSQEYDLHIYFYTSNHYYITDLSDEIQYMKNQYRKILLFQNAVFRLWFLITKALSLPKNNS
jgi:hypothetical protein